MNLFIEAPRRVPRGRELGAGPQKSWVKSMQEQYDAQMNGKASAKGSARVEDGPVRADSGAAEREKANGSYSMAQDSYREELAFHARRARLRRLAAVARVLGLIVAVPVALAAVFAGSYVLTCIVNGATPDDVIELLKAMPSRLGDFARTVLDAIA